MNAVAERNEMAMSLQHCQLDLSVTMEREDGSSQRRRRWDTGVPEVAY